MNMQLKFLNPADFPNPSKEFQSYFNSYLELCKFSIEERLGILFYLGATLPGKLRDINPESSEFSEYIKVLSLYSKSTGDFSDYGDLNDAIFNAWIYNANLAISKISADDAIIDENLRTLPFGNINVGKSDPKNDFLDMFNYDSFSLNVVQNLNDELFIQTGKHLKDRDYSSSRAYEAGFAYRMMMLNMDLKGTDYLLSRINSCLSPLFESIFYAPMLYVFNNHAFKANHLFSQILNNFYGGQNSKLFPIAQSIHLYHQYIFYKENSSELRNEWLFNHDVEEGSAISIFLNAINIRKTNLKENAEAIKQSGEVYDSNLIDARIGTNEFLKAILGVIQSKYSINGYDEFMHGEGAKWNTTWNNKGDYIQYLVILFYETCLHALVVDEIK
jgi:hypothetical protein